MNWKYNLIYVRKWGYEQTDGHRKNLKLFENSSQTTPRLSPKKLIKIAHPELEISTVNLISVSKWGNEQTDRHTGNMKLYWTSEKDG